MVWRLVLGAPEAQSCFSSRPDQLGPSGTQAVPGEEVATHLPQRWGLPTRISQEAVGPS
jgi:hypothetical protein